jgi:mannose-6-phosphate isomerase-like protein (cupin superfamily)
MQIRRVVTGHDNTGKAIVLIDGIAQNTRTRAFAGTVSTLMWVTDGAPADISSGKDQADRQIATAPPEHGSIFRIVDFAPVTPEMEAVSHEQVTRELGVGHPETAARHPFTHRTKSIDYALVLSGEIDMLLDDSDVHLKAGDVLIQQGTNHAWVNRGSEVCRIAFVLIDAKDV